MSFLDLFPTKRKSKVSRWSFLLREPIYDLVDPGDIYLDRLWLVRTPWGALALHKINRPDNDRHLHNHPWVFTSLILRGGYEEEVVLKEFRLAPPGSWWRRVHRSGSINRMELSSFHAIRKLLRVPTWTLVAMGPKVRIWGYLVPGDDGRAHIVNHDDYHHAINPAYQDEGRKEKV